MVFEKKKGHVFSIDVVIAFMILLVGVAIIFYKMPIDNRTYYITDRLSGDILDVLSETKVSDICSDFQSSSCSCNNYDKMDTLICSELSSVNLLNKDPSILELFTEVIQRDINVDPLLIEEVIREIFVEKRVVDEKRFGFALIYSRQEDPKPHELYSTDQENNI